MSQSDNQLLANSHSYLVGCGLSAMLALAFLLSGHLFFALLTGLIAALLFSNKFKVRMQAEKHDDEKWFKLSALILAALVIIGLGFDIAGMKTWLYIVPLLIFFCFDFKPALWYVGIFSLLAVLLLNQASGPFENVQLTLNYVFYLGISCSLVYLREVRRRQLKPLRRTDNLTMAATREHLDDDLTKEIQRSEREGSDLATIALAVDPICLSKLSTKERDTVSIDIGKLLHNNLRLFDSYYLWAEHGFLVVLPHTSSAQGVKIANSLRVKIRQEITINDEHITVSAGVAGLNVGDTSSSLTEHAEQALKNTQEKGSNHTQLYRDDGSSIDADNGEELS